MPDDITLENVEILVAAREADGVWYNVMRLPVLDEKQKLYETCYAYRREEHKHLTGLELVQRYDLPDQETLIMLVQPVDFLLEGFAATALVTKVVKYYQFTFEAYLDWSSYVRQRGMTEQAFRELYENKPLPPEEGTFYDAKQERTRRYRITRR